MASVKSGKLSNEVEEDHMENVELHRAESMIEDKSAQIIVSAEKEKPRDDVITVSASRAQSILSDIKQLKIEVIMFLYMFSSVMRSVSSVTMIMDKVCLVHLGYSEEVCANLSKHEEIKLIVEKMANNYNLGHTMVQLVPSAVLCCFIGSWSDKYGRKPPIIAALIGIILDGLGATLCAAYFYSRAEYYLIPALFTGFSGGFISVLTVLYSYASDVTAFRKRTMKYAFMEVAFGTAMPLGSLAGGWIYKFYGYVPVFMVSTCGHVFGLGWVLFFLDETRGAENTDDWHTKISSLWSFESLKSSYKATVKLRPNRGRMQILLLIAGTGMIIVTYASTAGIAYLYVHHVYEWDNTTYSTVSSVFSVIGMVAMLICVPLAKRWNAGDATLGIVGSVSQLLKNVGTGLASRRGVYFLANLLGLLSGLASLAGRSRISKLVSKDELGKVFAFLTSVESILPAISMTIVSQVFNFTLDIYPGLIYLVLGVTLLLPLGVFIWLARLPVVNYEEMCDNPQNEGGEELSKPTKF